MRTACDVGSHTREASQGTAIYMAGWNGNAASSEDWENVRRSRSAYPGVRGYENAPFWRGESNGQSSSSKK